MEAGHKACSSKDNAQTNHDTSFFQVNDFVGWCLLVFVFRTASSVTCHSTSLASPRRMTRTTSYSKKRKCKQKWQMTKSHDFFALLSRRVMVDLERIGDMTCLDRCIYKGGRYKLFFRLNHLPAGTEISHGSQMASLVSHNTLSALYICSVQKKSEVPIHCRDAVRKFPMSSFVREMLTQSSKRNESDGSTRYARCKRWWIFACKRLCATMNLISFACCYGVLGEITLSDIFFDVVVLSMKQKAWTKKCPHASCLNKPNRTALPHETRRY